MRQQFEKRFFQLALHIGDKTFEYRYNNKAIPLQWKLLYEVADGLVFKKIRSIMGGRAELFISGGAPLSKDIAEFFFRAGFTILEGYGLSETVILTANRVGNFKFGAVGLPFEGVTIDIADDGEIRVKSPSVMKGYYKKPEADCCLS